MINEIKSLNYVSGYRISSGKHEEKLNEIFANISGFKKFKLYLDEQDKFLPYLNIVLIIDKNFEVMNKMDNSLNDMENLIYEYFRFKLEKVFIYIIWK